MIAEFLHSVQDRLFPHLFVEARLWAPLSHSLAVWLAKLGFYSKLEPFYSQFLVDLLNNLRPLTHHFSLDKALGGSLLLVHQHPDGTGKLSLQVLTVHNKIQEAVLQQKF